MPRIPPLGTGARKRKHLKASDKFKAVMHEWKQGTLHSGSGQIVTSQKQAEAIAFSEARKKNPRFGRRPR